MNITFRFNYFMADSVVLLYTVYDNFNGWIYSQPDTKLYSTVLICENVYVFFIGRPTHRKCVGDRRRAGAKKMNFEKPKSIKSICKPKLYLSNLLINITYITVYDQDDMLTSIQLNLMFCKFFFSLDHLIFQSHSQLNWEFQFFLSLGRSFLRHTPSK